MSREQRDGDNHEAAPAGKTDGSNGSRLGVSPANGERTAPVIPHVVIVGGGFGGLYAAKALRRSPVRVTLIDRKNHHTFQPLLYQVATAGMNASEIAVPIRRVLRKQKNVVVLLNEVTGIDLAARQVALRTGEIAYDYLILATGATHSYFGHDDWARFAPGLKSVEDALEIRGRIFSAFEAAEWEDDEATREALMTFVIVGGGPTGVELAGTLVEIARRTLPDDFRRIDPARAKVILIESAPRVLTAYVEPLSANARQQLDELGVDVRTGAPVTAIDSEGVTLQGERIAARTVLWAAGVAASPLARTLGVPLDRAGRVLVEPDLSVPGHPEAFVIGDLAAVQQDGKPVPGVAPAAMQGGQHVAACIRAALQGKPRPSFHYRDKGSLATIGRAAAIADFGTIKLTGFIAWVAWFAIHIFFLIGFRNRFLVLWQWAWAYMTYDRGARLITGDPAVLPTVHVTRRATAPTKTPVPVEKEERAPL
jgi:NADH dehydrogenase